MGHWFPLPESVEHIRPGAGCPKVAVLWALLSDPAAEFWRDKVGVRGLQEGSAKTSTRLLYSQGWVLKTDRSRQFEDAGALLEQAQQLAVASQELGIWHPQKGWFGLYADQSWFLVTLCPRLWTLRSLQNVDARLASWLDMYAMGLKTLQEQGVELDLNPANFGFEASGGQLWYLDDETYQGRDPACIGMSLAHRMVEADDLNGLHWQDFGAALAARLADLPATGQRALIEGLEDSPMWGKSQDYRRAFLQGFRQNLDPGRKLLRTLPARRTCILADIHANLPALEAVLKVATDMNVTDYLLLGDYVGYGPHPQACIERLAALPLLAALKGNHDEAVLTGEISDGTRTNARVSQLWTCQQLTVEARNWLAALPASWQQGAIMAIHGSLLDPSHLHGYIYDMTFHANLLRAREKQLAAVFFGHSHYPVIYQQTGENFEERVHAQSVRLFAPGRVVLLNPGAVGQPRDRDPRAGFAIWDHASQQVSFFRQNYDLARTQRDLLAAGLPEQLSQRLQEGF